MDQPPDPSAPVPEPAPALVRIVLSESTPAPPDAAAPPPAPTPPAVRPGLLAGLTRNVFVLGLVSLFTDISSEMIVPVRILFLVGILGTPLPIAGLIEGVAESTASLLKIVAGRISDRVPDRKPLILFGYTLSNGVKPLMGLVGVWPQALGLIFLDRVGKGVRGTPRDAMLADSAPAAYRGKAFGFHRSMDTLGAALGPLFAVAILALTNRDLRQIFIWTALPGLLSILVIIFFLREDHRDMPAPKPTPAPAAAPAPRSWRDRFAWVPQAAALGPRFWMFTAITAIFGLGNSSDAFIFLRAEGLEQALEAVPLIYFGYNVVYAVLATPLGALSDRLGRAPVLIAGYLSFGLVYAGWAVASLPWHAWALFLLYGVYAAATEGVSKALVTDLVPRTQRGAAMGWFAGVAGLAALPANVLGGWLWSTFGPSATFGFGAWAGFVSAALMIAWLPWLLGRRSLTPESAEAPAAAVA